MAGVTGSLAKLGYFLGHPACRRRRLRSWARLLRWRLHCLAGIPASISLPRWDARFVVPPRWGGEGTTMLYVFRDEYETELTFLDRLVHAGDVVIDAGASCGIYTVAAGKLVGAGGRVVAIEPTRRSAEALRANIAVNHLDNVVVYEAAVSRQVGKARLYQPEWGAVAASIATEEVEGVAYEEVDTVTIDSIVAEQRLTRLDFIKLDIEGAEEPALRGGREAVARWHPSIVFEMNPGATTFAGGRPDQVWTLLSEWGYGLYMMSDRGELQSLDSLPNVSGWAFRNFVAVHPARR